MVWNLYHCNRFGPQFTICSVCIPPLLVVQCLWPRSNSQCRAMVPGLLCGKAETPDMGLMVL